MNVKRLVSIAVALVFFIPAVITDKVSGLFYAYFPLYLAAYFSAGWMVIKKAFSNIKRGEVFDENFLMLVASIGAFVLNLVFSRDDLFNPSGGEEMMDGVLVMILYQIGEFFQGMAVGKSRKSIKAILSVRPDSAYSFKNGVEEMVFPEEIEPGELFVVHPGEKIALDGVVESGACYVDGSAVTGESEPVFAEAGTEVLSGMICLDSTVVVKATKPFGESTASRMLKLVEEAAENKAKEEKFITRFARVYTPIVCALSLLVAVLPPAFIALLNGNNAWSEWIYNGLCLLVISCPCALVISVPLTFFGGIGGLAKNNVLVKGAGCFEAVAKADVFAFDKTGTITTGSFEITEIIGNEEEVLALAAAAERHFSHPIAKSITAKAGKLSEKYRAESIKDYPGKGIGAVIDGKPLIVGSAKILEDSGIEPLSVLSPFTVIHVALGGKTIGALIISDTVKTDSADAIGEFKRDNIRAVMMTGDRDEVARAVADKCGITEVHSSLLPEDKTEVIKNMQKEGAKVLYAGDGINDAPAIASADVGCAMGGVGSDAAIEAADVVIMKDSLLALVKARKHSKKVLRVALENIYGSLAVKAVLMVLSVALSAFPLWLAIIGDVGVCLVAIANAMRTLKV